MSKLKLDKINFDDDELVVEVGKNQPKTKNKKQKEPSKEDEINNLEEKEIRLTLERANLEASEILKRANLKAQKMLDEAGSKIEADRNEIINNAQNEANEISQKIIANAQIEADKLIKNSKDEIEKKTIEEAHRGYEEGYKDGLEKIHSELEEKIEDFDKFVKSKFILKQKILKSLNNDVLELVNNICGKILLKEIDPKTLDDIIKKTIHLLDDKENINIILSEKYAKLLFELQKKSLNNEIELNFDDFKQYENFTISYNNRYSDDTIIIENPKTRFDASIMRQLDVIMTNVYDASQNLEIEQNQDIEKDETE